MNYRFAFVSNYPKEDKSYGDRTLRKKTMPWKKVPGEGEQGNYVAQLLDDRNKPA